MPNHWKECRGAAPHFRTATQDGGNIRASDDFDVFTNPSANSQCIKSPRHATSANWARKFRFSPSIAVDRQSGVCLPSSHRSQPNRETTDGGSPTPLSGPGQRARRDGTAPPFPHLWRGPLAVPTPRERAVPGPIGEAGPPPPLADHSRADGPWPSAPFRTGVPGPWHSARQGFRNSRPVRWLLRAGGLGF